MAMDKLFKGILQVTETSFNAMSENDKLGHIIFVRKDTSKNDGDAEVWFGKKRYGTVEATRLAKIESDILALDGRVDTIEGALGQWTKEFTGNLQTVASVVKGHATTLDDHTNRLDSIEVDFAEIIGSEFDKENSVSHNIDTLYYLIGNGFANDNSDITAEILKIKESLGAEGDTANAIASAQSAANKAQGEVDALEEVVGAGFSKNKTVANEIARVESIADAAQTADEVSAAIDAKISDLNNASHTHSNKALLDTYTQTDTDLADAVSKKHEHTNKTELDKFVDGDKAKWDGHVANEDIHVTAQQKTDWQNATNAINAFLDENATADNVINTLVEIREYLNGEDGSVETLLDKVDALEKSLADGGDTAKAIAAAEAAAKAKAAELASAAETAAKAHAEEKASAAQTAAEAKAAELASAAQTAAEDYAKDAVEKAHSHANKTELDKFVDGDKAKLDTAVQTVSVAVGCEMLGATKEGTTVTLALYYGGDDAE